MVNASAQVTYTRSYEPYGAISLTSGSSQTAYGCTSEYTGDYNNLVYLRARFYAPGMGRFLARDTWKADKQRPISYNSWLYVYANPINLTDPSGHDPWWCDGQYNEEICYAQWNVDHGGKLTAEAIESLYSNYPEEILGLLQQQFNIKLPAGYYFRYTTGGSALNEHPNALGVQWWFAEYNSYGELIEYSESGCGLFSTEIPSQATHIDYAV